MARITKKLGKTAKNPHPGNNRPPTKRRRRPLGNFFPRHPITKIIHLNKPQYRPILFSRRNKQEKTQIHIKKGNNNHQKNRPAVIRFTSSKSTRKRTPPNRKIPVRLPKTKHRHHIRETPRRPSRPRHPSHTPRPRLRPSLAAN